jgi:hypothetical protein
MPREVISMTIDELMREALRLDAAERASMAHELLNSLESLSDQEIETLWLDEAVRRSAELDSGAASTVSAEDAITRARARLR